MKQSKKWKEQAIRALTYLHNLWITVGGHAMPGDGLAEARMWYYINQHTVLIVPTMQEHRDCNPQGGESSVEGVDRDLATQMDAWISLGAGCTLHAENDEAGYEENRAMDLKGVERIFNS